MNKFNQTLAATLLFTMASVSVAGGVEGPVTVDGATTIDAKEARNLFENEVAFVDVRKDKDWEAGRVPEAYHLDVKKNLTEESLAEVIKKDETVVFYCNGIKCLRSGLASEKAVAWGYTDVKYFRTGFPAWKGAGNPVE
jgi:rhodanese-related sulfurtransferase